MNKKFCKNCRHGGSLLYALYGGWKWCEAPQLTQEKGNKYSGYYGYKKSIYKSELNSKGDCPHYKKKRWKFWVK